MKTRFNPFRPGRIAGPGVFAGRGAELLELQRILLQAKNGNAQHFLLAGERGIGKSSLMLFVKLLASGQLKPLDYENYRFLVLELELEPNNTYPHIIKKIAASLRRETARFEPVKEAIKSVVGVLKKVEAYGFKYGGELENIDDHELLEDLVGATIGAIEALKDEIDGILILIDEADKAPVEANLGSFAKIFTDRLTKAQCDNVCLGLAGVTGVIPKLRASHESAPRIFTVLELEPLEVEERKEVVIKGVDQANEKNPEKTSVSADALEAIAKLSEGYPHFLQQFAYSAFEADQDYNIDLPDVVDGASAENGALDQLGQKYFQQMFYEKINSDEYRLVLRAMAEDTEGGWKTKDEIRKATQLKETTLGNAIRILKERDIIIAKLGEQGVYRLPSASFAAWIRARKTTAELTSLTT